MSPSATRTAPSRADGRQAIELGEHQNNRVLIVDDQPDIHSDFTEMLMPSPDLVGASMDDLAAAFIDDTANRAFLPGFELVHAGGGKEACDIVRAARASNRPIAVAYVDIRMPPGIDGVETTRRMREIDSDIEIVLMTAYTDKPLSEIIHGMALPHKLLYIRKPFSQEEIQQITLSLVGKWNIEQALAEQQRLLAASHQRLEAVLDATEDALAMVDAAGHLVFANRRYEKLLELTADELKEIPPEALMARFKERFQEPGLPGLEGRLFLAANESAVPETIDGQMPNHRLFYHSTAPVRDGWGDVIGRLMVYRDVSREIEFEQMKAEMLHLRTELEMTTSFDGIVGSSPKMRQVYALMQRVVESDTTVLVRGESGTGKEVVARSLHFQGPRKEGPFLAINCAAIPETLIESELFGHEQGAFTGATRQRLGAFERAKGGTIFLDEVGDMPLMLQAKLLRVLQEREVQRVGGTTSIRIDVRLIAATNKNLEATIKTGEFRGDLFYRLAVFPIVIPPLRERREDIPPLANHFLKKYTERLGKSISGLSTAALCVLLQYDWPGNVRELENAIERAVLLETTEWLQVNDLPPELSPPVASLNDPAASRAILPLSEVERQAISYALALSAHNVAEAAQALGVNRATLYRKLKKYCLPSLDTNR